MRVLCVGLLCALSLGCNCGPKPVLSSASPSIKVDSNELDFGAVAEHTTRSLSINVTNTGRASLSVSASLDLSASAEFSLADAGAEPLEVPVGESRPLEVIFAPVGPGSDEGAAVLLSDDPLNPSVRVTLKGGPIFPALELSPDPLTFVPAQQLVETRLAKARSVGLSDLHVRATGVDPTGSAAFSVNPPMLPKTLMPGEELAIEVQYARSPSTAEGRLQVLSDDADAGTRVLRLIPDPAAACQDGLDNDQDGLIDFPDDPGCQSPAGTDEYNPPQCLDGGMQACGSTMGVCRPGMRSCANSVWGQCQGSVNPSAELCDGIDNDCNGVADDGVTGSCMVGICAGARLCVPDSHVDGGLWGACQPVGVMAETCNGLDDNCNGQVDEGIAQSCTINGCAGTKICVPGGTGMFTSCTPSNPLPETCNGADDNCNGMVDELPDVACGIGPCRRVVPACAAGAPNTCVAGPPSSEVCNGVDDNCDGTIDNVAGSTTCGVGACRRTVSACTPDGGTAICVPGTGTAETCNNIDDNCNGTVDEGISGACYSGSAATRGVGRCKDGTQSCSAGILTCPGEVLPAVSEDCATTLVDDNCNGVVNEGCAVDGGCNPNGLWTRDGGAMTYTCCGGLVQVDVTQFQIMGNGASITVGPTQSGGNPLSGIATTCPSGPVRGILKNPPSGIGSSLVCAEIYAVDGGFVGPNEWRGTYSVSFNGAGCTSFLCGGDNCTNQSWPVQAFR